MKVWIEELRYESGGATGTNWAVRWIEDGEEHSRYFYHRSLAERYRRMLEKE